MMDLSGHYNHPIKIVEAGVSRGGKGSSALFNGNEYIEIPHSEDFDSKIFSITFWMYLLTGHGETGDDNVHKRTKWCPLLHKGVDDELDEIYYRAPALFLNGEDGSLKI